MSFDASGKVIEDEKLLLTQRSALLVLKGNVDLANPSPAFEDRLPALVAEHLVTKLAGRLVDAIGVGRHATFDDLRAQPIRRIDDDFARIARERVGREENTRHLSGHHRLDHDAHRHRQVLVESAEVRKYARSKEARPTGLDGVEHLVFASEVQDRHVHTRSGRALLVFMRRGRAHREARRPLVAHRQKRVLHGADDVPGKRGFAHARGHCVEPFVRHVRGPKQSARSIRDLEDTRIERIADPARHRVRGRNRKARTGQSRQAPGFAPVAGGSPRNDRFDSLQYPRHLDLVVLAQPSGGSTRGDGRQRSPALCRDPWR